jgi:PAS domain S-box-containing protein
MIDKAGVAAWDGSLETFRLLANSLQAMIAYYDAEHLGYGCRFANKAYASTFGLTEASIIGKTFVEVIGEAAAREVKPSIDTVTRERRTVAYVRELAAPDGTRRWIEVNVIPNVTPDGRPMGAFVIVTDITGHRLAMQALRESEERLAKFMQASHSTATASSPTPIRRCARCWATRWTKCSAAMPSTSSRPTSARRCRACWMAARTSATRAR